MAAQHLNVPLPFWLRLVAARNETNTPRRAAKPHCAHFVIVLFQHVIVAGNQIFSSVTKQLCKYSARRRKKNIHTHKHKQVALQLYMICVCGTAAGITRWRTAARQPQTSIRVYGVCAYARALFYLPEKQICCTTTLQTT